MRRVRAADGLRRGLAEAEVADLALGDELAHRADGLLDRRLGIDAVQVVEVDVVAAEALQRALDRAAHVLRRAVERAAVGILRGRRGADPHLRGELDLVAAPDDGAADELLVREGPVHLRGIEEGAAELEGPVDRRDRLALVGRAVEGRHAHAAQADLRHGQCSEIALVHRPHVRDTANVVDVATAAQEAGTVRKATAGELPRLAQALAAAFDEDPPTRWVFGERPLEPGFLLFLRRIWFPQDECYTTGSVVGACVWERPGEWKTGL